MPAFTNVIVSYNSSGHLQQLLDDLRRHAPYSETIIIDNASTDGTAAIVASQFPQVYLVTNPTNVGYARAVNQGIALSKTPHVFLLNPDIRILESGVFEALSECLLSAPCVAVAGPLQFKQGPGRPHLNFTWSYWTPRAFKLYIRYLLRGELPEAPPLHVSFLNAGCLFLSRAAYEAVGGLNEKYFLYGEEPDLFLKFKRFGYECRLVPSASVLHAREQSLMSVALARRIAYRLLAVRNITDALFRGLSALLMDRLTGRSPAGHCRD